MPSSSRNQFAQHVRVSSTEDLSYNIPTGTGGTKDVIQTIVTGRKCWKTMKGKGEVVWPPHLEAALVEGLEQYRPVETRSTRALGRFPMRNKFISGTLRDTKYQSRQSGSLNYCTHNDPCPPNLKFAEYIFKATGKRRTPKQVGSRLQQLRDTCEGKRILKLLSSRPADSPKLEDEALPSDAPTNTPSSPSPVCDQVTIDVLPADAYWPYGDFGTIPSPHSSSSGSASSSGTQSGPFNTPRPLRAIDSTVTFRSGTPIQAYSAFRVLKNGHCIHTEDTELDMRSSSCMPAQQWLSEMECIFYYSTRLVPRYWRTLCEMHDLSTYSIVQNIVRTPSMNEADTMSPVPSDVILSVVYNFKLHPAHSYSSTRAHSPASTVLSADADNLSYSAASSPESTGEFRDLLRHAGQGYGHHQPSPQIPAVLPPFHALQSQLPAPSNSYELPPELIRDGDDGYNSLPQSPLDFAFPTIPSTHMNTNRVVVADTTTNDLTGGLDLGRGFIGVSVDTHNQGCYGQDVGLNVDVQGGVSMLRDIGYTI
ncbi:hypothetical protein BXZ70DRAFT_742591 [Cristinia sonorae]|uniref:TEA domain-containing protein n=1 Tax=Cristinia sonorae TaxID=1940300 RepID=A0A8K0UTD9_9AGAR|nr:hypothetical protein BXZ70DRAFT_742591 [Cristinia sonorae]